MEYKWPVNETESQVLYKIFDKLNLPGLKDYADHDGENAAELDQFVSEWWDRQEQVKL